jgi:glutathione peroxidase-family protein
VRASGVEVMQKVSVNGGSASPVYTNLKAQLPVNHSYEESSIYIHVVLERVKEKISNIECFIEISSCHQSHTCMRAQGDGDVPHNFFKYLVDRRGIAVKRFSKKEDPLSFVDAIEALLQE